MSTKRKVLLLLAVLYGMAGVAAGFLKGASHAQGLLEYALSVAMVIGIYVWCRSDLQLRSPPRSGRWALWSALLPPLVVPVYLFRTRAPGHALKSVAKCVGVYLALALVFAIFAAVVTMAR